jgi:hypothetical protein
MLLYIDCRFSVQPAMQIRLENALAAFCPQCRAAVVPGMATCQFCGAQVDQIVPADAESRQAESAIEEPAPDQSALAAPLATPVEPTAASPSIPPEDAAVGSKPPSILSSGALKKFLLFYIAAPIGVVAVIFIALRLVSVSSGSGPGGGFPGIGSSQPS